MSIELHSRIVIVGAGIGGLAAALALHRSGFSNVTLLESVKEIKPLGVGINIQPEAVRILCKFGMTEQLEETGIATAELRYLDHRGVPVWTQACGKAAWNEYPQYSIHRGELQMLLLSTVYQRLGKEAIRTGVALTHVTQTPQEVTLHCKNKQTKEEELLKADLLIGADGIDSMVRSTLHPDANSVRWSAITMWRGVTLLDHFLDGRTMTITHDQQWSRLVTYPISRRHANNGKALVNWVCLVPVRESPENCGADWNKSGRLEDVLPYFAHWNLDWLDVRHLLRKSELILQYPMVDRDPLPFWSMGRITLLGDAAHLMYPMGANGASQAILDAEALACALAQNNDLRAAFTDYENKRRDTVYKIVLANRKREQEEWAAATLSVRDKQYAIQKITNAYHDVTAPARCIPD